MQAWARLEPDAAKALGTDLGGGWRVERRFAAHVIAVEAAHDMHAVADAK